MRLSPIARLSSAILASCAWAPSIGVVSAAPSVAHAQDIPEDLCGYTQSGARYPCVDGGRRVTYGDHQCQDRHGQTWEVPAEIICPAGDGSNPQASRAAPTERSSRPAPSQSQATRPSVRSDLGSSITSPARQPTAPSGRAGAGPAVATASSSPPEVHNASIPLTCVTIKSLSTNMSNAYGQFWNNYPRATNGIGCPNNFTVYYIDPGTPGKEQSWQVFPAMKNAFVTQRGAAQLLRLSQ
jgi:hypothetical protein